MTGKELIDYVLESGNAGEYDPKMLARGPEGLRDALSCLYRDGSGPAGGTRTLYGLFDAMKTMTGHACKEDRALEKDLAKLPGYLSAKETVYRYAQVMLDHLDFISGVVIRKETARRECRDFFRKISEDFPLLTVSVDCGRYLHEFYDAVGKKDACNAYERALSALNTVSGSERLKMSSIREQIRACIGDLKDTPEPMTLLVPLIGALKAELLGKIICNPAYPLGVCKVDDVYISDNIEFLTVEGMTVYDNGGMLYAGKRKTYIKLACLEDSGVLEVEPRKLLELAGEIAPSQLDAVKKII